MTGKPEMDLESSLTDFMVREAAWLKFGAAVAVVSATLALWVIALSGQGYQNATLSAARVLHEARSVAQTVTTWESAWAGSPTTEAVETNLYADQDVNAWGEQHKRIVLQARSQRKAEEH